MATTQTTLAPALSVDARLYKYVRTEGGWKYCRAHMDGDRVVPDSVYLPKTKTPTLIEGGYYVASGKDQYDKIVWHRLHEDPQEAERLFKLAVTNSKVQQLQAQAVALQSGTPLTEARPKVVTVAAALKSYLADIDLQVRAGSKKPRSLEAIEDIVTPFCQHVGLDKPLASITREMVLGYLATLSKKNGELCKKTTRQNHFIYIQQFLNDRTEGKLFKKGDCPRAPSSSSEDIREFTEEEIKALLSVASDYHRMCWRTYLMSGMREGELTHLYKGDVRRKADGSWIIRVEGKPELNWFPKTWEERDINIPTPLALELVEFSKRYMPSSGLLFPTSPRYGRGGGKINGKLLDALKSDAREAGLNPEDYWLHAWRSTYATRSLRGRMAIPEVQRQLGHKPGSTTIFKYWRAAQGAERQKIVDDIWHEIA